MNTISVYTTTCRCHVVVFRFRITNRSRNTFTYACIVWTDVDWTGICEALPCATAVGFDEVFFFQTWHPQFTRRTIGGNDRIEEIRMLLIFLGEARTCNDSILGHRLLCRSKRSVTGIQVQHPLHNAVINHATAMKSQYVNSKYINLTTNRAT